MKVSACYFSSKIEKRWKRFGVFKETSYICSGYYISNAPKGVQYDCQRDMALELISLVERHNILIALTIILRSPEKPRKLIRNN